MKDDLWNKIRYKYYDVIPYDWRPSQIIYYLKCVLWKRYTVIKGRYLSYQWTDRVEVLPHTMMEILSQFIERECNPEIIDWEASGHIVEVNGVIKNVRQEMQDIYDWWHNVYNKEYHKKTEKLWVEIQQHSPENEDVPLDSDFNPIGNKKEAVCFEWKQTFANEEDRQIYNERFNALHELDKEMEDKLDEMCHRLINIRKYLWT